ncbi:MAG: phosphatidylserine decarboxylase [Chlamydiae bacterium]|nr:phosphatidylserine decarboxylase [Chlamydiota bacterium]
MYRKVTIINRMTKQAEQEEIYGQKSLVFLYKKNLFSRFLTFLVCKSVVVSKIYGWLHKLSFSKRLIAPFIKRFNINIFEFEKSVDEFASFNDFFIRTLKKESRPFVKDPKIAIIPADSRCLVFENFKLSDGFYIKGEKFLLKDFLQDKELAEKYVDGSIAFFRLAPQDYHRFHFSFDCKASTPKLINGYLYSVNPIALKQNIKIFSENKRMITELKSPIFGEAVALEIGATNVGSIHQTFLFDTFCRKKEEKGYFSFFLSIVYLFEKNKIKFDLDLIENSKKKIETRVLVGEFLGSA